AGSSRRGLSGVLATELSLSCQMQRMRGCTTAQPGVARPAMRRTYGRDWGKSTGRGTRSGEGVKPEVPRGRLPSAGAPIGPGKSLRRAARVQLRRAGAARLPAAVGRLVLFARLG